MLAFKLLAFLFFALEKFIAGIGTYVQIFFYRNKLPLLVFSWDGTQSSKNNFFLFMFTLPNKIESTYPKKWWAICITILGGNFWNCFFVALQNHFILLSRKKIGKKNRIFYGFLVSGKGYFALVQDNTMYNIKVYLFAKQL